MTAMPQYAAFPPTWSCDSGGGLIFDVLHWPRLIRIVWVSPPTDVPTVRVRQALGGRLIEPLQNDFRINQTPPVAEMRESLHWSLGQENRPIYRIESEAEQSAWTPAAALVIRAHLYLRRA